MKLDITAMTGMAPMINRAMLPDNHAATARDVATYSGAVRPVRRAALAYRLDAEATTIHRARNGAWLAFATDTEVAEAPLVNDQYSRIYYTNAAGAFVTAPSIWSTGSGNLPRAAYSLGQPAPLLAPTVNKAGTPGGNPVTRYYTYTRISVWGEESPPAPLQAITLEDGETATVTDFVTAPAGRVPTQKYRIYRSATGTDADSLLIVADTTGPSFEDTVSDAALGDPCPSVFWDPPPAGLRGLTVLPNGALAGIVGRDVVFSEPNLPHAWPDTYRLPLDHAGVALGTINGAVVVATDAYPYLLHGSHPSSYLPQKLPEFAPCLAARGCIATAMGITWPSTEGLYAVGQGGRYVTLDKLRKVEWEDYYPATMAAASISGGYVGFYQVPAGDWQAVKIDLDGTLSHQTLAAQYATTSATDGYIYALSADGRYILQLEGNTAPDTFEWTSKLFRGPIWNPAAARVDFEADWEAAELGVLPIGGFIDDAPLGCSLIAGAAIACDSAMPNEPEARADVVLELYADGQLKHSQQVTDTEPFRLPGGYLARELQYVLRANTSVRRVVIADSMEETA